MATVSDEDPNNTGNSAISSDSPTDSIVAQPTELSSPAADLTLNPSPEAQNEPQAIEETDVRSISNGKESLDLHDSPDAATTGDNTVDVEPTSLRDDHTTNSSTPGDAEAEESNQNTGDIEPSDRVNSPNSSSHKLKHLSTTSFTRTVAHDVNWGEEDTDSEFNVTSPERDQFASMAQFDRTNSFPPVPPAHQAATHDRDLSLPHNETEEIMGEAKAVPNDMFADDGDDASEFFARQNVSQDGANHESSAFDRTFGGDYEPATTQDAEARYEEGVPLVHAGNETSSHDSPDLNGPDFGDDGGADADFFSKVNQSAADDIDSETGRPSLGRKSTLQVLGGMQYEDHDHGNNQTINEEDEEEQNIAIQDSFEKVTGGGISASQSTIVSQVLGDPQNPLVVEPETLPESGDSDADLAAKWKAALEGDEFLDDDELLTDEARQTGIDPAALFGSDDEGFLDDAEEVDVPENNPAAATASESAAINGGTAVQTAPTNRYTPISNGPTATTAPNSYTPATPLLTDLSKPLPSPAVPSPYASPYSNLQPQVPQQASTPKAESFAAKSKGGYTSPYDLPMEIVKPRKRVSMQQLHSGFNTLVPPIMPPPRSSSAQPHPPPSSARSAPTFSPQVSSGAFQQNRSQSPQTALSPKPAASAPPSKATFFEELPVSTKPKPATRHHVVGPTPPAQPPYAAPPVAQFAPSSASAPPPQTMQSGLVPPERVSPYTALSSNAVPVPTPVASSRYSPAPPMPDSHMAPPPPVAQSRYSPAPPSRPTVVPNAAQALNSPPPILPHQPRTSSPLAHFERSPQIQPHSGYGEPVADRRSSSSGSVYESLMKSSLPPTREEEEEEDQESGNTQQVQPPQRSYTPKLHGGRRISQTPPPPSSGPKGTLSPPKRSNSSYIPSQPPNAPGNIVPPPRSKTQSPTATRGGARIGDLGHQPEVLSPSSTSTRAPMNDYSNGRPRGFSQGMNYIPPADGRELDPLQRWRGAPVFAWGVGGTIVTSFPKDVPRYGMNTTAPMIVRSPGEVKIQSVKDLSPLEERLVGLPGPLKGKSKKKEVVAWLSSGIETLERGTQHLRFQSNLTHDDKRMEERVMLWKVLRTFIEFDGVLEGNPQVNKAVRNILSPGIDEDSADAPLYATGAELSGIAQSYSSTTQAEPVDATAVDQLRRHLLRGEREKAVWEAVDKRLWGHAMLISNTVSKELYQRVTQEFVKKEVKELGENTESLAALYEIFAGNFEESIDELVPLSARAGYQMVSASNAQELSKDALAGLDRWRETLCLALSNRSIDDSQALRSLGNLLSDYGRAEAAHICYLFARSHAVFGGRDDPSSSIVLVGSDHRRQPFDFDKELEPILLTEVYEYGLSLSNTSSVPIFVPHLAAYKMQHALFLAEHGYRDRALQYCEAITSSITSQTKRSPYYHPLLATAVEDLSKRLKQAPKDGSSSWISKPSIDKVSGSVWATFNKFVAGDDQEAESPATSNGGSGDVGPFARIAGGTPTVSRSPSNSDIYGTYGNGYAANGAVPIPQPSKTNSRYAPGGSYTPPGSSHDPYHPSPYGSHPRSSFDRSSSQNRRGSYEPARLSSEYQPSAQPSHPVNSYTPQANLPYSANPAYTPPSNADSYGAPSNSAADAGSFNPYEAQSFNAVEATPSNGYASNGYEPPASQPSESYGSTYEPPTSSGYEPPTDDGYQPPSYEPATMNDEPDSSVETRPKKKGYLDDDDDIPLPKPIQPAEKTRADRDREADDAFRRAAEEDAKRDKEAKEAAAAKKGWGFGSWFGGGKKDAELPNKPIKAKLGEESSFVYDPDLKRWVNKKAGSESTTSASATPPPPKGPPRSQSVGPRSVSAASTPPSPRVVSSSSDIGPPGFAHNANRSAGSLAPPAMVRSVSNGSTGSGPGGPPSRPGTSMSNASSIDDLLGPATARKGTMKKPKRGRGYIDVMQDKAAS
ncbi:Sec23-binding domain of Sec16-domain-containing protein [Xylogone sp. PMI_703]|nr:Sec23-binding domain of Sec16-domain-containing protein [Xylogone sp. PMI_703]